jgi:glycosyltransferase involved in cell wall biosynthesis
VTTLRRPRHILVLVENLSVPFDRRVWHECTTLVAAGYEVSVICPRGRRHDREPFEARGGVRIHRYPPPPSAGGLWGYPREYGTMLVHTLRLAVQIYRRRPFDTIHACNPPDLFFLIGRLFRPLGVSFVFDHHDANPEILVAKRGGEVRHGLPERVVGWSERATFARADVVISPNDSYRRIALERGGKAPQDVFVVRSAPRWEEFSPVRYGYFDRRGHRYLVGYLGVMGKQDGVDLLVEAVAALVGRGYDILLYLAGNGESFDEIADLAGARGIAGRVLMPGYQTQQEFGAALLNADVCVAPDPPSPFNDISTMNKVVEYMALGRPCVCFALPENKVTGGDAVSYVEGGSADALAQAIGDLLDDERRCRELGARARERFERVLAWEHSMPPLLEAYERLAEKLGVREPVSTGPDAGDDATETQRFGRSGASRAESVVRP